MKIIAILNSRLSGYSPVTVYLAGVGDTIILVFVAFVLGLVSSKI